MKKTDLIEKWGPILNNNTTNRKQAISIESQEKTHTSEELMRAMIPNDSELDEDFEEEYVEILPSVKIKISPSDKNHYVNSKVFRDQIINYYESDKMTNELAINVMKIAEGLSYNHRFIGYSKSWKDDMVGDATIKMYAALESKKFRVESEFSPFAYFNRIAWNAFCNRIKKEKKQHEGLQEYKGMIYEDMMSDPSCNGHVYVKPILECDSEDGNYED